jgi:hypothetical protein
MSEAVQKLLKSVKVTPRSSLWDGAENAWVRSLGTVQSAQMAQDLVCFLTDGKPASTYASGYKVLAGEHRIEIRMATLGLMGSSPAFMWQRIDMSGDFTDLCLIAVYPNDARLFIVPRADIDQTSMSKLKGHDQKYQLTTKRIDDLFPWMVRHEITGAP